MVVGSYYQSRNNATSYASMVMLLVRDSHQRKTKVLGVLYRERERRVNLQKYSSFSQDFV
jgi:heme exporter protein D